MSKTSWKPTPKAKIYEALSAVADSRVEIVRDGEATVRSSDRSKSYSVIWNSERSAFGANDNASYWVGYMGYPIIATLFELGLISLDREIAQNLSDINWNRLNKTYKSRYDDAVNYVLEQLKSKNVDTDKIRTYADVCFHNLKALGLGRLTPPGTPPSRR